MPARRRRLSETDQNQGADMRGTSNRDAFKVYVEGERLFSVISESDMKKSRECFAKATKLDSKFARAWGWRSYTTMRSIMVGWLPESDGKQAGEWAQKAVDLDPNDYATYWDLAFYQLNSGDFDKALKTYKKALDLYENFTDWLDRKHGLLAEMAEAFIHVGKPKEAIALLKRACRVPDWYKWNLGWAYFHAEDYASAARCFEDLDLKPGDPRYVMETQLFVAAAHLNKADLDENSGNKEEATRSRDRARRAVAALKKHHPKYSLQDAIGHRSKFKKSSELKRWESTVRKLLAS